jgi:hypothetical protein
MKKLIILAALAFALTVGTAAVMTVHPQQAIADPDGNGGG